MSSKLRLVDRAEALPLPSGALLVVDARRPGELYDVVALGDAASLVAAKATRARVGLDLAATLLIELHLLQLDLVDAGFPLPAPPSAAAPTRRLTAAEGDYLRTLTFRRAQATTPAPRASVPVRLLPRITRTVVAAAAATGDLEHAIAWEVAALLEGRTIAELGLLLAVDAHGGG
jgi:hypothetical protein